MGISSDEGKYDIIEPWEHSHISLMMDVCRAKSNCLFESNYFSLRPGFYG